ncbi:MAG: proline--tRNA ligase [Alphaproteobacteria bacterium]|jgi:prolyl-tRNA synthetase|nr:proline--tRNA ligase [Alphaproteobacteria bacterium]MDP6660005.1 proline--tRNA ligase [Alphaproteobacteria bacterium]MDP6780181.1 proline--tRNA ligase [Alphaproteobacteria bacterium]MDP7044347.1 proline--tRNA ligase [Alphaproteobacteria bacterium]|tara:strand:+ start:1582 stop:2871 length:1290 start_codon:yes stop_codon:yes gene_type:complete
MRLSKFFLPTLKETPAEAQIASHRLMLRAGMIRQESAGIYSWLPLGLRVLKNIEIIIREEQDAAGAQEILMPTIQPADLWRESGRYDDYGKEMLRIEDRHGRDLLYGPTNEEMVTSILKDYIKSYRELPVNLYHIQWKFRDEVRPRFGVMRGREFLMKDAYSFDLDLAGAKKSYDNMFAAYLRTFARMGLKAVPVRADPGAIGGDMSHEFHILAETGESAIFYDAAYDELTLDMDNPDVATLQSIYAAEEALHDPETCPVAGDRLKQARGIEVGHIFYFGTKYSKAMDLVVDGPEGERITPEMGSYGIGVSRLPAAVIEASHDENGIIWPDSVAPFTIGLVNLKVADEACVSQCEDIYNRLREAGVEALYDDREERPGAKFADMDLIGLPWRLVVGPRGIKASTVELKRRAGGEREELSLESALAKLTG